MGGPSQLRGEAWRGVGVESAECEDGEYPVEDAFDQAVGVYYSSDSGAFEYEYKPTKGTSRSEKMRANKASAVHSDTTSLRKSAPAPVRTKKSGGVGAGAGGSGGSGAGASQPKFAMVPGEGMKFVAGGTVGAGTSLESASTPLGDQGPGMIPNLSTSSFHDQQDLMIRVGSETHLVPPSSNALPLHNDPCVVSRGYRRQRQGHFERQDRLPVAGMKRATSEPYIPSLQDFSDPLVGIDDLMNDADVLGGGMDLGLLTGSSAGGMSGMSALDAMNGMNGMGIGMGAADMSAMAGMQDPISHMDSHMDQDLLNIQSFVDDQASKQYLDEAEEIALNSLEFQPKPRKLSKSVSMTNIACQDVSDAANANANDDAEATAATGIGSSLASIAGRPPAMPKGPFGGSLGVGGGPALASIATNGAAPLPGAGLRRISTFTGALPSLDEVDLEPTPRFRASSHNSSDEDLVKQLWAGESTLPSLHI